MVFLFSSVSDLTMMTLKRNCKIAFLMWNRKFIVRFEHKNAGDYDENYKWREREPVKKTVINNAHHETTRLCVKRLRSFSVNWNRDFSKCYTAGTCRFHNSSRWLSTFLLWRRENGRDVILLAAQVQAFTIVLQYLHET